jgi:outer membrane lipoprotein-sorting protein
MAVAADRQAAGPAGAAGRTPAFAAAEPATRGAVVLTVRERQSSPRMASFLIAWLLGIGLPLSVRAQSVDEIVTRHVEARGNAAQWQAVRAVRMTGRALAGPGREALVTREIKRPGRVRTEFTFQGITGVFAFDGKRGWEISPLTGVLEPRSMDADETLVALAQADLEGPLAGARKQGAVLTVIGRETVAGREAYHIRATTKSGPAQDHYVDAETFLILRTETSRSIGGRTVDVETMFSDYRSVGGLVFPHTIEMGRRNRPERVRIVVETIELNPSIEDGRFKAPSGTRR